MFDGLFKWLDELKKIETEISDKNKLPSEVRIFCGKNFDTQEDLFNSRYSFPSKAIIRIAKNILNFEKKEFTFNELLHHINEKGQNINECNIDSILFLLSDTLLYKAYQLLNNTSYSGLFTQLNSCIILDAMRIKPDKAENIATILFDVSEKASMCINNLSLDTIWAIAMLNYKMHIYETAIMFFNRFLTITKDNCEEKIKKKKIHARIYVGYCYEKSNKKDGFNEAIQIFLELLKELENNEPKEQELINELHHGLGHFFNERAVFGNSKNKSEDLIKARIHMKKALFQKIDYYSCYGSLFHEFGDYENAQRIFSEATACNQIETNDELKSEMAFYEAQTDSSLASDYKRQFEEVQNNFNIFEEYCKNTFNYDGIVHARIFKIRTFLSRMHYSDSRARDRKKNKSSIEQWCKELTEYTLSDYASESIKSEYKKTKCILDIFSSLYADDRFIWHMEDLQYYLSRYISLMPKDTYLLDYAETDDEDTSNIKSNLYQVEINNLRIWTVSSDKLSDLKNSDLDSYLECDSIKTKFFPIKNKTNALNYIKCNGKPDIIVLIPPTDKNIEFENEIKTIIEAVSESCFVLYQNEKSLYDEKWLVENVGGKRHTLYYTNTLNDTFKYAYCCRAFEILRKDLLDPIPLFSLAPTHFSSSYDFQLGEDISIQKDYLCDMTVENEQRKLLEQLNYLDRKYSSNESNRKSVRTAVCALEDFIDNNCCSGDFIACFPAPSMQTLKDENFISYCVNNTVDFHNDMFSHNVERGKIYTIKSLPTYRSLFWRLISIMKEQANECENDDDCLVFINNDFSESSDISYLCNDIIKIIFPNDIVNLCYPYKCIYKRTNGLDDQNELIYLIINNRQQSIRKTDSHEKEKEENTHMPKTVFVTYAWKPEGAELEKYQKEVLDFTNQLRAEGFDATFDLAEESNNWYQIMIDGLQKDKVIVLLSKEYKEKAEKSNVSGVSHESKAIMDLLKNEPQKVIFVRLKSQSKYSLHDITPNCFPGEKVIDLSKTNTTDGLNLLYSKLLDDPIIKLTDVGKTTPIVKKF